MHHKNLYCFVDFIDNKYLLKGDPIFQEKMQLVLNEKKHFMTEIKDLMRFRFCCTGARHADYSAN